MLCDATRLRQVVWNLLQNAIKFTPVGGCVALRVERTEGRVHLIVSDTGRGIEPVKLAELVIILDSITRLYPQKQS